MKLKSLKLKDKYFNWKINQEIDNKDFYQFLFSVYKIKDFITLQDALFENKDTCLKVIKDENLNIYRDKNFEQKILQCLDYGYEDFNDKFACAFKEDLVLSEFDIFSKPLDSFVISEGEYDIAYDREVFFKEFYGEKLGEKYFQIEKYALENNNTFNEQTLNLALQEKIEPNLYCISQYFKALNVMLLTEDKQTFNEYIDKYFESYLQIPIFDCVCGCYPILEHLHLKSGFHDVITHYFYLLCKKVDKAELPIRAKFIKYMQKYKSMSIAYSYNEETQEYLFKNDIESFVYLNNDNSDISCINVMSRNLDVIDSLKDYKVLRTLYYQTSSMKDSYKNDVVYNFKDIPRKKFFDLVRKLKNESKAFDVDIYYSDDISFAKLVHSTYRFIKDKKFKNSTTKEIIKTLKDSDLLANAFRLTEEGIENRLQEYMKLFEIYQKAFEVEEYLKNKIFEIEFSEKIELLTKETEDKIKEFKNNFYKEKNYNFDKYYQVFIDNLEESVKKLTPVFKKEEFFKKFNEIILEYKTQNIKDSFATNEYTFAMLKTQKMELTPIFVCFLKGVEQFLCSFINYILLKKKVKSDIFSFSGKKYKIFNIDWNEMHIAGKDLENYLKENFFNYNKIDEELSNGFSKEMEYWRDKARNGNLHKDNVYNFIEVQKYISCCYNIISILVLTLI